MSRAQAPLRIRTLRDPVLLPVAHDARLGVRWRVGGIDAEGHPIDEMRLRRFDRSAGDPDPPTVPPERISGEHLYAGVMLHHFGHFLLESLARLWAMPAMPDLPLAWHVNGAPRPWQSDLLRLAGLAGRPATIVRAPTRFETLHVPEPGFVIGQTFHPAQAAALGLHRASGGGARVWLSRSGLRASASAAQGEAELEACLAAAGWTVFHPERHDLTAQLDMLGSAAVLAGIEGSAFHNLALIEGFGGRVVMVPRNPRGRTVNGNHTLIFAARGIPVVMVGGLLRAHGAGLAFIDPRAAAAEILAAS